MPDQMIVIEDGKLVRLVRRGGRRVREDAPKPRTKCNLGK